MTLLDELLDERARLRIEAHEAIAAREGVVTRAMWTAAIYGLRDLLAERFADGAALRVARWRRTRRAPPRKVRCDCGELVSENRPAELAEHFRTRHTASNRGVRGDRR
jgi:hypothetical protein